MRKAATISAILGLAVICFGTPVRADGTESSETVDDLDLVKLLNVEVSTATKTSESLDEAPAIITVVTQRDIRRWGYQSVAEVLNHTVGFYLVDDHILPNAGVRGMTGGLGAESGVIKVMIDGRSTAYRTTSGNWLGIELVSLESIAQIEIIRGPASALYGADAFLGVVNIITVRPDDIRPVRARVAGGTDAANAGGTFDILGGKQMGHYHLLFGATGENADRSGIALPSQSPAPTLPSDIGDRRTANNLQRKSLGLQARGGWADDRFGHVTVSAYASTIERGGDFAHWAQLTNETDADGVKRGTVVALGQYRLNLDTLVHLRRTLDLAFNATYSQGGVRPADRVEIASDLFYVERHTSYKGTDATLELRFIPSQRFNLIGGVEGVYDREHIGAPVRVNRATGAPIVQGGGSSDLTHNLSNVGAFLSSTLKVIDPWLKLTGGLRYDHHSEYGTQFTGRLGLTSRLSKALVAKLLYGSAFKAPSPYLLYATPLRPGDVVGNPLLQPQKLHTVEFQVGWKPNRVFGLSTGVSYNWLLNKAEFTPQGINLAARNVAKQRTLTWETRADINHYDDYSFYGAFELVQSVRDLGQEGYAAGLIGSKNVIYPPWIGRVGGYASIPSPRLVPLAVASEVTIVGPRRAADTSIVENGGAFSMPAYAMLNLSLTTRDLYLIRGHETRIALRYRNVLEARGPDPGPSGFEYPLAPRQILLEIQHLY